jgi:alpha-glucoside transport system permease protein
VAAAAPAIEIPRPQDTAAAKVLRFIARAPVHIILVALGALWLIPTFGLLITSLLPASTSAQKGWWVIFSHPSLATWSNYNAMFHNSGLVDALKTTAYISVGNTLIIVVIGALAGYALAWLDFPGRDWLFIITVGLLVVPLQMALIPMFKLYSHPACTATSSG